MECVILYRNTQNDRVGFVRGDDGEIAVFPHFDAAIRATDETTVCKAFPYQIVELEDL